VATRGGAGDQRVCSISASVAAHQIDKPVGDDDECHTISRTLGAVRACGRLSNESRSWCLCWVGIGGMGGTLSSWTGAGCDSPSNHSCRGGGRSKAQRAVVSGRVEQCRGCEGGSVMNEWCSGHTVWPAPGAENRLRSVAAPRTAPHSWLACILERKPWHWLPRSNHAVGERGQQMLLIAVSVRFQHQRGTAERARKSNRAAHSA